MDDIFAVIMAEWDALIELMQAFMNRENISRAELARRADLSPSQVSKILNRLSPPGNDAVAGLARALHLPRETVFRAAGLLPQVPEEDALIEQITNDLGRLSERRRQQALDFIRFLASQQSSEEGEEATP